MSDKQKKLQLPGKSSKPSAAADPGFDRWLDRQVRSLYDPVLEEKIPDHLLELLDAFGSRDEAKDATSAPGMKKNDKD